VTEQGGLTAAEAAWIREQGRQTALRWRDGSFRSTPTSDEDGVSRWCVPPAVTGQLLAETIVTGAVKPGLAALHPLR
jgi:hypothetical protein